MAEERSRRLRKIGNRRRCHLGNLRQVADLPSGGVGFPSTTPVLSRPWITSAEIRSQFVQSFEAVGYARICI